MLLKYILERNISRITRKFIAVVLKIPQVLWPLVSLNKKKCLNQFFFYPRSMVFVSFKLNRNVYLSRIQRNCNVFAKVLFKN